MGIYSNAWVRVIHHHEDNIWLHLELVVELKLLDRQRVLPQAFVRVLKQLYRMEI